LHLVLLALFDVELDEVAFMRFASVYQEWETLEDFEAAIAVLKVERENQASSTLAVGDKE